MAPISRSPGGRWRRAFPRRPGRSGRSSTTMWWKGEPGVANARVLKIDPSMTELLGTYRPTHWWRPTSSSRRGRRELAGEKQILGPNSAKKTVGVGALEYETARWAAKKAAERNLPPHLEGRAGAAAQRVFEYDGRPRNACPVILGSRRPADEAVKVYQVGGETARATASSRPGAICISTALADCGRSPARGARAAATSGRSRSSNSSAWMQHAGHADPSGAVAVGSPLLRPPREA